jgi:hypothetical protein
MTRLATMQILLAMVVAALLAGAPPAEAADSPIGTYLKKAEAGKPAMSMTIEQWAPGKAKLTYRIQDPPIVLTIVSALDGSESPVLMNGKPSGETMAIKLVDKLHSSTVVKMDGKPFGTSKGTFAPDFSTLTVENDFSGAAAGGAAGKSTERWIRK